MRPPLPPPRPHRWLRWLLPALAALLTLTPLLAAAAPGLDARLRGALAAAGVAALEPPPPPPPPRVALGRALFFDPLLSGNRDISCATCHHPTLATGDARALSIGSGGRGLGADRAADPSRTRVPRNATELFNRGLPQWRTMFWDGRVEIAAEPGAPGTGAAGRFLNPALAALPAGLESPLAVQAMFPVTSRDEMRGYVGDRDVLGAPNELAMLDDDDFAGQWAAVAARLRAEPEYVRLFAEAFPGVPAGAFDFTHAATALADFQADAWTLLDSPFDRYLRGDDAALPAAAKRGALLFYGAAGCAGCHGGPLLTDQDYYNLGVPQLGPGKGRMAPLDPGRADLTGEPADAFAFRTPPLRNVAETGPWMHNGAYATLEGAVRHHLDPRAALAAYDPSGLEPALQGAWWGGAEMEAFILETLDPVVDRRLELSDAEVDDLLAFLEALTDPRARAPGVPVPGSVPSGLPVDGAPR